MLWKARSVDGHESDLRCVEGGVLALRLPGDGVLVVPDLAVAGLQPLLHGLPLRGVQLVHQPRPLTLGHLAKLQHKEIRDVLLGLHSATDIRQSFENPHDHVCILCHILHIPPCTLYFYVLFTFIPLNYKSNYKQYVEKLHHCQTGPSLDTDIEQSFITI